MLYNGDDSQAGIKSALGAATVEQARTLKVVSLNFKGKLVRFRVLESGDLKYLSSSAGHAGCSHTNPCMLCECPRKRLAIDGASIARTRERVMLLSHTAPLDANGAARSCPCCGTLITAAVAAEAVRISESDAPADIAARLAFSLKHLGILPGVGSMLDTDPSTDVIICLLHCLLNVSAALWKYAIGFVADDEAAKKIVELMQAKRFHFRAASTLDEFRKALDRKALTGQECLDFFKCKDEVLEVCFARSNQDTKQKMSALIAEWEALWFKLTGVDEALNLEAQAESIRVDAVAFRDKFMAVAAKEQTTLYFHILTHHVKQMIMDHGNLVKYGSQVCIFSLASLYRFPKLIFHISLLFLFNVFHAQGLEHLHKLNKNTLAAVSTASTGPRDCMKRLTAGLMQSRNEPQRQSVAVRRAHGLRHRKTKEFAGIKACRTAGLAYSLRNKITKGTSVRAIAKKEARAKFIRAKHEVILEA
jgi:hypothetical protein